MNQVLKDALAAAGAAVDAGEDYRPHITQDQLNELLIVQLRDRHIGIPGTP